MSQHTYTDLEPPLDANSRRSVWLCTRDQDGAHFVRKYVSDEESGSHRARFEREIRLLQTMSHPNVVRIEDAQFDDRMWYVMPPFKMSLHERILREMSPLEDAEDEEAEPVAINLDRMSGIFTRVLRGVAYVHWKGIMHRDLKPANVLLNSDDDVVVADFGIARRLDTDTQLTVSLAKMGTPPYWPPELKIDAKNADRRSDIFSLGIMLREMLTGSPYDVRPEVVPLALAGVISKAAHHTADRRYQTVQDLQRAWRTGLLARRLADARSAARRTREWTASSAAAAAIMSKLFEQVRHELQRDDVYSILMTEPRSVLRELSTYDGRDARMLLQALVDYVEETRNNREIARSAAHQLESFAAEISDPGCRAVIATGLLGIAVWHNLPSARANFEHLAQSINAAGDMQMLVDALLDLDPAMLERANTLASDYTPAALRELLQRLFQSP